MVLVRPAENGVAGFDAKAVTVSGVDSVHLLQMGAVGGAMLSWPCVAVDHQVCWTQSWDTTRP